MYTNNTQNYILFFYLIAFSHFAVLGTHRYPLTLVMLVCLLLKCASTNAYQNAVKLEH